MPLSAVRLTRGSVVSSVIAFIVTFVFVNILDARLIRFGISLQASHLNDALLAFFVALLVIALEMRNAHSVVAQQLVQTSREQTQIAQSARESLVREESERHLAEGIARASQTRFAEILDISADAIISVSSDQRIVQFNQGAEKTFGYRAEEMMGQKLDALLPEAARRSHSDYVSRFAEGSTPTMRMCERRGVAGIRKDGTEFPAEVTVSKLEIDDEVTFTAILRDVSERVLATEALSRAHEELEVKVADRTKELGAANQYLRELSGLLLASQEDERRRIARELHDSTSQLLAAAVMGLGRLQDSTQPLDANAQAQVSDCQRLIEQAASELRTVSYRLHPPMLEEFGLLSALKWYVTGFSKRSGISIDVQVDPELGRLERDVEMTIFRIVQEALTNVHRHARVESAQVTLSCDSTTVRIEVMDRGKGISTQGRTLEEIAPQLGVGIAGMRERTILLGGAFDLRSDANGTMVSAVFPIAAIISKNEPT